MMNDIFRSQLNDCAALIETTLDRYLPRSDEKYARLIDAMRYSLLGGGKRIRGVLCLKFCQAVCGSADKALHAACAVEMLHAYTLIHDDLPCMDDDDMRRGKPSNHIEYGEFTATLAGDAMQACAFQTLLSSKLPSGKVVEMAQILSETSGPHGVCGGQYLDLSGEGIVNTADELMKLYSMKTSALITASACLGVMAGGGTQAQFDAAGQYSAMLGLAFQVRDDMLDCISTEQELGKPIGSDLENKKNTLAMLLGMEECERMCGKLTQGAISAIEGNFENTEFLKSLAIYLMDRKN